MLVIDRYQVKERILDGGWYQLYAAECTQHSRKVVLKYLVDSHPSEAMLACFRTEYHLLKQLAMPDVIKVLDLVDHGRRLILVREYFPGLTLRDYSAGQALPVQEAYRLISELAETIAEIHSYGIVHGNLNPDNILINADRMQWKLIGFSCAKFSSQPKASVYPPLQVQSIDYLAPEQGGRLNRSVDGRADIYAMGVMLFELLTGYKPFESEDAIGLIHRHIAQSIPDPRRSCPQIPENLARIVVRMLAKDPNERYEKALDLLSDLTICRRSLLLNDAVDGVSLTESGQAVLKISQRVYGRDAELAQLDSALADSRQNKSVLCLVSGRSGVGKSRLFEVFSRKMLPPDCFFVSAKCDQYQVNAPASLFYAAFRSLLQHLLGEHEETLSDWRQRLLDQLDGEAQPIIELLPELEMLLGPQRELPELPTSETKTRLIRLWVRFVQTFCRPERPLCLFLDDLQWADPALFEWLEPMLFDIKHLLLIGAYRDNSVEQSSAMMLMENKFRTGGGQVETIDLAALPMSAFVDLVADSITLDEDSSTEELCSAIYTKTQGNPFFFIHYLRKLQQDGVLAYHAATGSWRFDSKKIHMLGISDNVVDFMSKRMHTLAEPVRDLLKIVACIGSAVDQGLIATVFGEHTAAQRNFAAAETSGLLLKLYGDSEYDKLRYVFSHDRVQQAAHSLCTEHELLVNRLKIGRFWVKQARDCRDRMLLFQAVDHLNAAQTLIVDPDEQRRLASDNFKLGLWAKHRGAFEQALPYLQSASDMLAESLQRFGGLAAVLRHRAECEHLCGHHQQAKLFFEQAVEIAGSGLEKARIFELMIQYYADLAQFDRAYQVSRQAAALFNIDLPVRFNRFAFLADFLHLKYRLRNVKTGDLLALPTVSDAEMDIAIRLLSATLKVAYQLQPELCAAISVKQVKRALQYGNNPEAVIGYMVFGVIFLGGVLGNHQAGYDYGRLSLGLLDKYTNQRQKAEVNFVYGYFAHSWRHPAADTETYWRVALTSGLESGDWFHSGCACCGLAQSQLMRGVPLDAIWHETDSMLATLKRIDSREHSGVILGIRQAIQNLRGHTDSADSFNADGFDEAAFTASLSGYGSRHFAHYYYVNKMQCLYLWGKYDQAFKLSKVSEGYLKDSAGMLHAVEHHFYTALILAKLYSEMPRIERWRTLLTIHRTRKNLQRWARHSPQNFLSRCYLLTAEIHRLRHRPALAIQAYHKAAGAAEANGQLHLEALANELAARMHKELGQERLARFHCDEAAYCYKRWGATGYLQSFKTAYGQHLPSQSTALALQGAFHALDTVTLIKASETIAAERRLPILLQTLMHIVIENAGAQRGILLLQENGGLVIQAEAEIDVENVAVMQRIPLTAADGLPYSVINFVSRSKETVVLENAVHSAIYNRDKAIAERRVRSLLCAPLLLQGELQGILYLENNAADAVFTGERVFLLQHLCGQIAISIDNAQGYLLLENKVAERTAHIETQKSALKEKNSELQARNATIEALNECLQIENRERLLTEHELQKANIKLQHLATIDGLTQIGNRRRFDDYLEQACRSNLREKTPLALILCDIDFFKVFNDHYGHQAGDECLKKVAQAIASALHRPTDLAARYGGEEFAVVLPHTDPRGAVQIAGLIRQAVIDLQIPHPGSQVADYVTISVGIASAISFRAISPRSLIKTADDALYQVKENGRNGIIHQSVA